MKIGLAQIDCHPGDVQANTSKFFHFAALARESACEVVVFPELSDTGYITSLVPSCAEPWPGISYDAASQAAAQNSIHVLCGISERQDRIIYNSLACFDTQGRLLAKYRKTHLFSPKPSCEDAYFGKGDALACVNVGACKWGLSICYDLRFPELYRSLSTHGAEVLLNCAAWPNLRPTHWDHLTRARAIENQSFFIGVCRVGTDGDTTFNGQSRVVSPTGEIVCEASGKYEELLIADIDLQAVREFREKIPALKSRRPELYC